MIEEIAKDTIDKKTSESMSEGGKFAESLKESAGKDFAASLNKDINTGKDFVDSLKNLLDNDSIGPGVEGFDHSGPQFGEDGNLKPNTEYQTGEYNYKYKTDDQGRIISVETDDLKKTEREERLPHNKDTPGKQEGDDAGHLIGDRFGGSPDIDNLVSQLSDVNRGEYKKMENEWDEAIDRGEKVQVKIDVKYEGDDKRPSEIIVHYKIGDGDWEERRFSNKNEG
jgi:hypothetical protein